MTFVVNQNGVVFEKNLGPNTVAIARRMSEYDPDKTWLLRRRDLSSLLRPGAWRIQSRIGVENPSPARRPQRRQAVERACAVPPPVVDG